MKKTKRILSVILVLAIMFALGVPAFAAKAKTAPEFKNYMCLGDSIAAGCALPKNGQPGDYFDYERLANDYVGYLTELYDLNSPIIYRGYSTEPVPYAYHSMVADELGAQLYQRARSGLRAVEFRYFLDGVYNDYDKTRSWGNTYFDMDGDGFDMDDLDVVDKDEGFNFVETIKKCDLISVNLGSNDVIGPTFSDAFAKLSEDLDNEQLDELRQVAKNTGIFSAVFIKLLDIYETMGKLSVAIDTLANEFSANMKQFKENYTAIVKAIYAINPDITVIGVGVYNPFQNIGLSKDSKLSIATLAAPFVNEVNQLISKFHKTYGEKYIYADVLGTETYELYADDPTFASLSLLKIHPTIDGHKYMAQQILNAIENADRIITYFPTVNRYASLLSKMGDKIYDTIMQLFARILSIDIQFGNIKFG